MALNWTSEITEQRVTERGFLLEVDGERVPGIAWAPEGLDSWPTILLGHGGTQHKRTAGILSLARRLARHCGYGAVSLDAPDHGDRRSEPQERVSPEQMRERIARMDPEVVRTMADRNAVAVGEWHATLDALEKTPGFADGPFGYWGVSMGTAIGLPFVSADPRISAAVLGLAGLGPRIGSDAMADAARALTIPVLFLFQWDDELMDPQDGLNLFEAFGSAEKTMHINPGGHIQMPAFERDSVEAFFRRHLPAPL
ncbi:MAG: dienelactone hydrolase family protein [Acidimicrobiales bacterium]